MSNTPGWQSSIIPGGTSTPHKAPCLPSSESFIRKEKSPGSPKWLSWGLFCWTSTLGWCHDLSHSRAIVHLLSLGCSGPTPRREGPSCRSHSRGECLREEGRVAELLALDNSIVVVMLSCCFKNHSKSLSDLLFMTCLHFCFQWHTGPS